MPEGYGYVRDSQPLFVDWTQISKSYSDRLKENEDKRKATEKDILNTRKEYTETLQDLPTGLNELANQKAAAFAQQAMDYSLENFNGLKDRTRNLQQYNAFENNLNSGTKLLFRGLENFNKNFDTFAERALTGKASQVEVFLHELMQNYTDWSKVSVDINPNTGTVYLSELDEKGNPTKNRIDVSQIGYFSNFTQDTYDINAEISKVAQGLGEKFLKAADGLSLTYQGLMYDDIISNDKIKEDLAPEIQSLIDQDYELQSIITDWLNIPITTDKSETDKFYYNQETGKFEPTQEQKDKAFDYVEDKLFKAITIKKQEPAPQDKTKETLDLINTLRLSGVKIPPELFTQLLKDKGLTDEQITALFPEGVDENVFNELSINLESLLTGLTPEILQSGQAEKKRDAIAGEAAINKELRRLRSIGIKATYDRENNQILINKVGADDNNAAPINLEGKTLTEIYDSIINEIPIYQSIEDIFTLLEFQKATRERREGQPPGDVLFSPQS